MDKKTLLLGTRKGLIVFKNENGKWKFAKDAFQGVPVSFATADQRSGTWWACQDHGHWGCKLHFSKDEGRTWEEVDAPAYPGGEEVKDGVPASLTYMWVLQPGNNGEIFIGTEPGGLFKGNSNGSPFELNRGLWDHPSRKTGWFGGGRDNPGIHSIIIDPADSDHMYIGISCAGVFETRDGGKTWFPRNKGLRADFLPDPDMEIGQDPHLVVAHPEDINFLWQQNHCGIFRSVDGGANWTDIGEKDGPANFGFAIAVHEKDKETAWVVPADSDQNRMAIDRALCVCRTTDGGKSWERLAAGLPQELCYDIVYRHALDITGDNLVFGTTTGNVYLSSDGGDGWQTLGTNMPLVYSTRFI